MDYLLKQACTRNNGLIFKSLLGILIVFVVVLSRVSVYSQDIKRQYNDQYQQSSEARRNFIRERIEYLMRPLRNVESCYQIEVSQYDFSPYICKKKKSGKFMVIYGPTPPSGYYGSLRYKGSLYGDNGFEFLVVDEAYTSGRYEYAGFRAKYVAILKSKNSNLFYVKWASDDLYYSNRYTETALYECYPAEMKCYAKKKGNISVVSLNKVGLGNVVSMLEFDKSNQ